MTRLPVLTALSACLAFGQGSIRETQISLVHLPSAEAIVATLKVITGAAATPGQDARTVAVKGTPEQVGLAEWVVLQMDKPAGDGGAGGAEYRTPGSADDSTRIFPVAHAAGTRELAEISTVVRSALQIPKMFAVADAKSIVVRGTANQIAGTEWLLRKLDRPVSTTGDTTGDGERFQDRGAEAPADMVAVFHLAGRSTDQSHTQAVSSIRTKLEARRAFSYMPTRAIVIHGTAEQLESAAAMVAEIDKR